MVESSPVVVVISVDPRASHRANEAMRIGLGIVAGENAVIFVLLGPGAHLLDEDTDELIDGDDISRFRANLASWNADAHPVVRISRDEAAGLVRNGRRVLVF